MFSYYNRALFKSQLPFCLINLSRHRRAAGFFIAQNWQAKDGKAKHEISINPDTLHKGDEYWHGTLVHEMCHLWQAEYGQPSRYGYHNKEWTDKMIEIGLMPSSTGQPGGKITGQHMSDYVLSSGPFQRSFQAISEQELHSLRLPYITTMARFQSLTGEGTTLDIKGKSGVKVKYSCACGTNVWGKRGLQLKCLHCHSDFAMVGR